MYTGNEVPPKLKGETKLRKDPINIIPVNPKETLDPLSRLNLAKTYPIEHNVKVKEVGSVNATHLRKLINYWENLTDIPDSGTAPTSSVRKHSIGAQIQKL